MKKYILILLLTVAGYGQTLQSPTYNKTTTNTLVLKTNVESATANRISAQETDGKINWLQPINIPIPIVPTNYMPTATTLGGHLIGIDNKLGTVVATTAGITTRVWFTADVSVVSATNYYATNATSKGTLASAIQNVVNNDNVKTYFAQDLIGTPFVTATLFPPGVYAGNLSASTSPNSAQQRWTVELYKCNNAGTPISSGVTGAPVGSLGVTVITILDSGLLTLVDGSVTNVQVSGNLGGTGLSMAVGERVRYHVSAEKVGTAGANITQSVYYGTSYNSYIDVPVPLNTTAVQNLSGVVGATTTDALNWLNANKADKIGTSPISITTTAKSNGEQFYASSGESLYTESLPIIETQSGGTGTDFTPSQAFTALKFTTSASVSFIQGLRVRVKRSGAISSMSSLRFSLYSNSGSAPSALIGSQTYIYGGQMSTSFQNFDVTLQNITTALSPSTVYWIVIDRVESGGVFIFDSQVGTGTTFQGATASTATTEANIQLSNIVYARNNYGIHSVGGNSHAIWGVSPTGVGVRGDGENHYGGYFSSNSGDGARGTSIYGNGLIGVSSQQTGVRAYTSSSIGYPALRADNTNGDGFLSLYVKGTSTMTGKVTLPSLNVTATPVTSSGTYNILSWNSSNKDVEKLLDSDFAHIARTETFTGEKTFTGTLRLGTNALSSTANRFTQLMGGNDYWSIYGADSGSDNGTMVFEVGDNGTSVLGQKFEFRYNATDSGVAKTTLTIDYNEITANANITATSYTGGANLTGNPTAPTPTAGDNDTSIATTAFVANVFSSGNYIPTLSAGANITSLTLEGAAYFKIGDVVSARISVKFSTTAGSTASAFTFTLPVNRALTTPVDIGNGTSMTASASSGDVKVTSSAVSVVNASFTSGAGTGTGGSATIFIMYNVTQ